jgi:hypothetical protein
MQVEAGRGLLTRARFRRAADARHGQIVRLRVCFFGGVST